MKKIIVCIACLILFLSLPLILGSEAEARVRESVVAGAFYPGNANDLRMMIETFLAQADTKPLDGEVKVLIVPHAGYIYSGPVAAYGFKYVRGKKYDVVVVMALSHRFPFKGASVYNQDDYATPLGQIHVDIDLANELIAQDESIGFNPFAHIREHSLEVELPFLQVCLGKFDLLPIIVGDTSYETCSILANALDNVLKDKNALIVVSTDLSHYHDYKTANEMDARTLEKIKEFDPKEVCDHLNAGKSEACGRGPLVTSMILAKKNGWDKVEVLKYANSGDTAGTKDSVVGYASIAFLKEGSEKMAERNLDGGGQLISDKGREELLKIVRGTLDSYLSIGKIPEFSVADDELQMKAGAFVTLRKDGNLRGCIGRFTSDLPIYKTVQQVAISSATEDPRFPPVRHSELKDITIEISVLSPMRKVESADEIELGKHGIYIRKGFRGGTFLPQVATETGWSKEEFLGHCARDKAGLGWDGWKTADVYTYTAEVFEEEKHKD